MASPSCETAPWFICMWAVHCYFSETRRQDNDLPERQQYSQSAQSLRGGNHARTHVFSMPCLLNPLPCVFKPAVKFQLSDTLSALLTANASVASPVKSGKSILITAWFLQPASEQQSTRTSLSQSRSPSQLPSGFSKHTSVFLQQRQQTTVA